MTERIVRVEDVLHTAKYIYDQKFLKQTLPDECAFILVKAIKQSGAMFTDELIDWLAEHVCGFAPIHYADHPAVRPQCVFVSSQQTMKSLSEFEEAGSPSQFILQKPKWMEKGSLFELQQKCSLHNASNILELAYWKVMAFVLFADDHFSVLVLTKDLLPDNTLIIHYDSMDPYHMALASSFYNLMIASGLLPAAGVKPVRQEAPETQLGAWQCGPAVITRLFQYGSVSHGSFPRPNKLIQNRAQRWISAGSVITNEMEMRHFLGFLVQCVQMSSELACLSRRCGRYLL